MAESTFLGIEVSEALPWYALPAGQVWQGALALQRDLLLLLAGQAVGAGLIASPDCDESALLRHGKACAMAKGFFESAEDYRARLLDRWENKRWVGTRKGMIDALSWAIAGAMKVDRSSVNITVKQNWEWGAWEYSHQVNQHDHRPFWIVIKQPHPFGANGPKWGEEGLTYGHLDVDTFPEGTRGAMWGSSVAGNGQIVDLIKSIAQEQCPAHARIVEIIVILSGDIDWTTGQDLPGAYTARWRMS